MNTLIKIIITAVIGMFGTLSHDEENQVNLPGTFDQEMEINNQKEYNFGCCKFEENLFKTLKNEFPS